MYLEKDIISLILRNAHIKYDYLFLSNDIKENKHTGKMYPYILKKLKISPCKMLHIGDSKRADYFMPRKYGIHSLFISKKNNNLHYYKDYKVNCIDENIMKCFINNNLPKGDIYYRIGYEILGILLLGYSEWLKEEVKKDGINKVFFLAREGKLLQQAFDIVSDGDVVSDYLYVSRRSTRVILLKNITTLDDVFDICKMRKIVSLESFFSDVGLNIDNYSKLIERYHCSKNTNIQEIAEFNKLFNDIKEEIIDNAKQEEVNLISYLKTKGFQGSIAISDVGWRGTMQNALHTVTKDADITGYYLGQAKDAEIYIRKGQKQKAYLFDYQSEGFSQIRAFVSLFESFFLAQHGTTIGYKNSRPVLDQYEFSINEAKVFQEIQAGAIAFVSDYRNKFSTIKLNIKPELAFWGIRRLGLSPTLKDVELFGDINYLDTKKTKLSSPDSFISYVLKPRKLYYDFGICGWKIGFVKRLFKIKLPYYLVMRNIWD